MDDMMSQKEVKRAQIMELLTVGKINQKEIWLVAHNKIKLSRCISSGSST